MNKIIQLTKIFYKSNKNENTNMPLMIFIGLLLYAVFGIPIGMLVSTIYEPLKAYNLVHVILITAFTSISTMTIFVSFASIINQFYFSKDIEALLPLPLRAYEILVPKFILVMVNVYSFNGAIFLPVYFVYGVKSSATILYYLYGIIIFFTLPIIPLAITTIITMILMKFINFGRYKNIMKTIGGTIGASLGLIINIALRKVDNITDSSQNLAQSLVGGNSFVDKFGSLFSQVKLSANALIFNSELKGLLNIVMFIALNLIVFGLLMIICEKIYLKTIVGMNENYSKKQKMSKEKLESSTLKGSPIKAFALKEIRVILRTPAFITSCIMSNLVGTLIIGFSFFNRGISQHMLITLNDPSIGLYLCGGVAMLFFVAGSNLAATSTISREGNNIYVYKYLPIDYKDQLLGKLIGCILINIIPTIVILLIGIILIKIPVLMMIAMIIFSILILIQGGLLGVIYDVKAPNLSWQNEAKAVSSKPEMMGISIAKFIALGAMALLIYIFKLKFLETVIVISISLAVWNYFLIKRFNKETPEDFEKLLG